MSKAEARKKSNDDLNNGRLLNEVEAISKALYLDRNPSKTSASSSIARNRSKSGDKANVSAPGLRSKHGNDDSSAKDKKSFWNWKPLKALSHIRNRRFTCCFTLDVHSIEGFPAKFNGLGLSVHWKRRDGDVVTTPVKVVEGVAEFEEKLTHTCSVYGSRSGPHHSAKYEAKHFLLYAVVQGNPKLDLGKHRVDLTRLLPLTLEELEDEKSSGTWTTNFRLSGDAKGAIMHVSFGYLVVGDSPAPNNKTVLQLLESKSTVRSHVQSNPDDGRSSISRSGTFPVNHKSPMPSSSVDDVKVLHEVTPVRGSEFASSVDVLKRKIDEEKSELLADDKCAISGGADDFKSVEPSFCSPSYSSKENAVDESEDAEYSVIEKGMESLHEKRELNEDSAKVVDESVMKSSDPALCPPSYSSKGNTVQENEDSEFSVIEKGMESLEGRGNANEDTSKAAADQFGKKAACSGAKDGFQDETDLSNVVTIHSGKTVEKDMCTKESLLKDLELVLSHVADLEKEVLDSSEAISELSDQENLTEDRPMEMTPSRNLDDFADSVADEFLDMLGIENSPLGLNAEAEPESPRERLLREFQKEVEASGCSMFGFDIQEGGDVDYEDEYMGDDDYYAPTISGWEEYSEDFDPSYGGELEYPKIKASCTLSGELEYPKIKAKVIEDMETQVLMEEWGLNENVFQNSPPNDVGFGSPIKLPPEEPLPLPLLGEGLGPFIQTKSGGFLRSMNPVLFKNAKSGGSLIMQVSSPVVVPAELGSGVMETVEQLASVGLEKLSMQANKLMPLEDITGKTMQQIAWEADPRLESAERVNSRRDDPGSIPVATGKKKGMAASVSRKVKKSGSSCTGDELDSEYVSLEDLAPLAMDKIEALSIEGLRIQSDMSDEDAPSNITAQSIGEFSALEGKRVSSTGSMGLDGAAGLKLLNIKESGTDDIDGLMGLSLTLDEWMRLDSGEINEEQMSERTSKLLAAHHANCTDLSFLGKDGKKHGKNPKRCGLLGNHFTVALMVQLRDPLRDYEPVGTPMLALIQVERVFLPPKPKIYREVAPARDTNDEGDELEPVSKEDIKEEKTEEQDLVPQYKVTEVHVAGLKSEPGKKKVWGNAAQQQSGSRWLLANGMGKSNKHPFMKAKVNAKSSLPTTIKSQPGDTLWSISKKFHGTGAKWKEPAALNPHIRNPDVVLSDVTIKLR